MGLRIWAGQAAMLMLAGTLGLTSPGQAATSDILADRALSGSLAPVHDPSIIKAGGQWYVYSTGGSPARGGFIPVRCSADRCDWRDCGFVFATLPEWVTRAVPGAKSIWAPDISYFDGVYHLYYAVSTFGSNVSAIGLATNTTLDPADPAYRWVDRGQVLASQASDRFNAIDPNILVDDDGRVWLSYGSFWDGIFQQEIDPATGQIKPGGAIHHLARRRPEVAHDPIEGASLIHKSGYYYLFVSWDYCCQHDPAASSYKIAMGRSRSPHGPFLDADGVDMATGGGTILLQGEGGWSAPGGQTAYIDAGRQGVIAFHALNLAQKGRDELFVNTLDFRKGWPKIRP